ncbi:MAG: hypothetical protein KU29_03295 [Sulfurovum sp. FS06-10]|nr:MAG: hypothetical protein KU29_03295 [Sulfurovum sp. FS06-10]
MSIDKQIQKEFYEKIPLLVEELNKRLIERDELSRLVVLAMLSKNHMFLIGERGVGKSKTVELVNGAIKDSTFWQLQINKDTKIKELYGKKRSMDDGTVSYEAKRSLLNTHYGVLDEMYKGRGNLLNGLLELLVDASYTSGDGIKRKTPLLAVFGTSNEYPTETRMLPFNDRFTVWYEVKRIQEPKNRIKFYAGDYLTTPIENQYFSIEDIEYISVAKENISIPMDIIELFDSITTALITQKVKTSDRKYGRVLHGMIRVSAYLNNRECVDISDIFLLLHTAWHDDVEKDKVKRVVFEKIFGNAEEIDSRIVTCKQNMEETDSFKNKHIYKYLNNTIEIDGINKQEMYDRIIGVADKAYREYQDILNELISLDKKWHENKEIEALLQRNHFISNYTQNAITPAMLEMIQELSQTVEKKIIDLHTWYSNNQTLFDYQGNVQKNKGRVA